MKNSRAMYAFVVFVVIMVLVCMTRKAKEMFTSNEFKKPTINQCYIYAFQDADYEGDKHLINKSTSSMPDGFNDSMSSVIVSPGCANGQVTLYQKSGYGGKTLPLKGGVNISSLSKRSSGWDNRTSSVKIKPDLVDYVTRGQCYTGTFEFTDVLGFKTRLKMTICENGDYKVIETNNTKYDARISNVRGTIKFNYYMGDPAEMSLGFKASLLKVPSRKFELVKTTEYTSLHDRKKYKKYQYFPVKWTRDDVTMKPAPKPAATRHVDSWKSCSVDSDCKNKNDLCLKSNIESESGRCITVSGCKWAAGKDKTIPGNRCR